MRSKYVRFAPSSRTDSNKLNYSFNNVIEDISELYRDYMEIGIDIEANNLITPLNTASVVSQISALEAELDILTGGNATICTLYDNSWVTYPSSIEEYQKCYYQQIMGEAVLPIAANTIQYHYIDPETGKRTIIDGADTHLHAFLTNNRFEPKINELYENSHINAFDLATNKAHVVKARTRNANTNTMSLIYNAETEGIATINTISVYPVPELACTLQEVTIAKPNGAIENIKDVTGTKVTFPISNARKQTFRFPDVQSTNITIIIKNNNYSVIDNIGTKEFVIGARAISIESNTYSNTGYIGLTIPVPSGKTQIGKLTPLYVGDAETIDVTVYGNLDEFNNLGTSTIISGDASTIQGIINTTISIDTLYVLFKLNLQENGVTPVLKGCTITWL